MEIAGLLIALFAPTLVLITGRIFGLNTLSGGIRLLLWGIAGTVLLFLAIDTGGMSAAIDRVGLAEPDVSSLSWGLGGAAVLMLVGGAIHAVQQVVGVPAGDREGFARIASLPFSNRVFIVLTAAVVEEVLFRGVPLTVGPGLVGGVIPAGVLAVAAFVLAHFRWKLAHLFQVAAAGAGLSVLFFRSGQDLWACIIAHLVVDAIGFLLVPTFMKRSSKAGRA